MDDSLTSQPERSPEGRLRVSDAERDQAIDLLADAATDGRLTLDEYSDRADRALTAVTRDDLATLTHDLAPARPVTRPKASLPAGESPPAAERLVAVFGSERRRGRWPVPARLESLAVFGECTMELQDATLHSRVTVIDARAYFGSIEILVPDGVDVRMTGMSVFGSRSCRVRECQPGAPVIEVRGRAVFGEVTVRRPGWKEGVRKAIGERRERDRP